jgi:hypothetical protein
MIESLVDRVGPLGGSGSDRSKRPVDFRGAHTPSQRSFDRSIPTPHSALLDDLIQKRDRGELFDHVAGLAREKDVTAKLPRSRRTHDPVAEIVPNTQPLNAAEGRDCGREADSVTSNPCLRLRANLRPSGQACLGGRICEPAPMRRV